MEAIEEDHRVSLAREVAILPRGEQRLEARDDPRDRALGEVPFAEQWFQRGADAATIHAAQAAAENSLVDLARPAGVPRQQLAAKFGRQAGAVDDPPTGDPHRPRSLRRRDRPLGASVPVPPPLLGSLVALRAECRRELLGQRRLQRFSNLSAELRFDVLSKLTDGALACVSLLHGVPPSPLITAICLGQQEVTPFSFFHKTRDTSSLSSDLPSS